MNVGPACALEMSTTAADTVSMAKKTAKKSTAGTSKRQLVDTGTDKRYVKRRGDGTFKESDDVGRAAASDRRRTAKKTVKPGFGDQGDQPRRTKKAAKKR